MLGSQSFTKNFMTHVKVAVTVEGSVVEGGVVWWRVVWWKVVWCGGLEWTSVV